MKFLYLFFFFPGLLMSQTQSENYLLTTKYKSRFPGNYSNSTQNINTANMFVNGSGGGSGTISTNNNVLSLNFSGSLSATSNAIKTSVKGPLFTPPVDYLELGPILTISGSLPTGYFAKIKDNYLVFYSPFFIKGINSSLSAGIATGNLSFTAYTGNLYNCPAGQGGGGNGGSLTINNGIATFSAVGSWSDICVFKTGQILYLNTIVLPDTELGIIKDNGGADTAYKIKIESNWLVIYPISEVPPLPTSIAMNVTKNLLGDGNFRLDDITYYDGLGRPKQTVKARLGGNGIDMVTPIVYDSYGRQTSEYLPYADMQQQSSSINFRNNQQLISSLSQYYQSEYPHDFSQVSPNPYTEKKYEMYEGGRIIEEAAPGKPWKIDPMSNANHTKKYEYKFNQIADNVKSYRVSYNAGNPILSDNGRYTAGSLFKTIIKNENWTQNQSYATDNTSVEFIDKNGRTVMRREFEKGRWHDSYNVYDDMGNLSFNLPPIIDTYPNSQVTWPTYSSYTEEDYSYYQPNHSSGWNESEILFGESGNFYFYLYDSSGPNGPLKTGMVKDLNLQQYPDVVLGPISIKTISGSYSDQHYTLSLQNGDLYISGDGTAAYGVSTDIDYSFANYQGDLGLSINADKLDKYAYQYRYDERNRLVEKKLPGKAWEYTVYDNLDRPILIQNSILRGETSENTIQNRNAWIFKKYDALGRLIYSGIWDDPVQNESRSQLQSLVKQETVFNESPIPTSIPLAGAELFYSNVAFPRSNLDLQIINYYDLYNNAGEFVPETSYTVMPMTNAKGLPTVAKVRSLSASQKWITSVTYYDKRGQAIYTAKKDEYLGTVDKLKSKYDFTGNLVETEENHLRSPANELRIVNKFSYDDANRLLKHKQTVNNLSEETIVHNRYDGTGNLISKAVGNTESQPLQNVDYSYNSRGWLKSINNPSRIGNDLFAMELGYVEEGSNFSTGYVGNVSTNFWRSNGSNNNMKLYRYQYDALGRIRNAMYGENTSVGSDYKFNETVNGYDRNGNIKGLYRYSQNPLNANASVLIDYLDYKYSGNKLVAINDNLGISSTSVKGFNDYNKNSDDFEYDKNGNLIIDKNKKIVSAIKYNHMDLPTLIEFADGSYIRYIYDANGVKLSKDVRAAGTVSGLTTEYSGKFVYSKNGFSITPFLQFFSHPEGYVANSGGVFSYIYQYKDHLGNVRLSYSDADGSGAVKGATSETFFDGFEDNAGWNSAGAMYGWQITAYDPVIKHSGKYSGRISNPTNDVNYVHSNTWVPISNSQPTEYIFSGWIYTDGPWARMTLFANKQNEAGYFTYVNELHAPAVLNQWIYVEQKFTINSDAVLLNARIDNYGGGNVWFDDISIRKVESNVSEIIEENNYYPLGLKHEDNSPFVINNGNSVAQKFKYGGKEFEDSFALNNYDFGARTYDPAIGRWQSIDPMAEKRSWLTPYNYVQNNPISRVDPTGKLDGDIYNLLGQHVGNDGVDDGAVYLLYTYGNRFMSVKTSTDLIARSTSMFTSDLLVKLKITNEELNLRTFLSTIKQTEAGRANPPLSYNTWNGGRKFTNDSFSEETKSAYSKHPGANTKNGGSTAAGAFQFLERFYFEPNMYPISQERAVVRNLQGKLYNFAISGDASIYKSKLNGRWTSFDYWKLTDLQNLIDMYRSMELFGNSPLYTPVGQLKDNRK